jgi:NAD(P)-dependent dehydrogenase (short-subunit alcohol dehydrogenase family)
LADRRPIGLVAGASGGIGSACAAALRGDGWRVLGVSRSSTIDTDLAAATDLDLTEEGAEDALCDFVDGRKLAAVVHSVGDIFEALPIESMPWSRWQRTLDLCVGSAVRLVAATYGSVAAAAGAYVFVSSVGACHPYEGIADYCAAKAALESFTRSLAAQIAPTGARANCVSPAVVDTALFRKGPYTEEEASKWHRLGRIGTPADVAAAVRYLCSHEAAWVTGQVFTIDGGFLLP